MPFLSGYFQCRSNPQTSFRKGTIYRVHSVVLLIVRETRQLGSPHPNMGPDNCPVSSKS